MKCNLTGACRRRILYALRHHAKVLEPLFQELLAVLWISDHDYVWDTWRGGSNSNFIAFNGQRYYLTARPERGEIEVKLTARGLPKWRWRTRLDVQDWGRAVGLTT